MNQAHRPKIDNHTRPQFRRICCEEPFRIFFPVGAFLGVLGVSLWPLFYLGVGISYPGISHARLLIEGFMASFVIGFLGTAGPRITSAPHFSLRELGTIFTFDLAAAGLHTGQAHRIGDICFAGCLLFFAQALARRFHHRKDCPPPNFALVALGLLSGIAGSALVAYSETAQYSRVYQFGSELLNQGFVLLPILGVAPFFLARLLDLPRPELPESRAFPPGWVRQAGFAAFIGVAIIASFLFDIFNLPRTGGWIRVAAIAVYLIVQMPFRGRSFLADCLRTGIMSILVGFTVTAALPMYRVGALHIVFITSFSFIAFTVAIRVVFGHSGNVHRLQKALPFFIVTGILLLVAMISRFTADLAPIVRTAHLVTAAICWLVASLVWMLNVLPKVLATDPDA
jgi:uncharacterized protein involved in response to NO